ncbi:hypothetical protein LCGC14_2931880, partial [marine sediment metagenome]
AMTGDALHYNAELKADSIPEGTYDLHRRGSGVWVGQVPCGDCEGTGKYHVEVDTPPFEDSGDYPCESCGGSGTEWPEETVVQICRWYYGWEDEPRPEIREWVIVLLDALMEAQEDADGI